MSIEGQSVSTSQNPTPEELLFKTWEQLKMFMNIVRDAFVSNGYDKNQADAEAVKWGNKIFENPKKVREIMEEEWKKTEHKLVYQYTLLQTQAILEKAGVPADEALKHAQTYTIDTQTIADNMTRGMITASEAKERIKNAKKNLNQIANEYAMRNNGVNLPEDLKFPDLYSPREVYNYAVDAALKGQWFPFVAYMADKNKLGKINVNASVFDIPPEDFKKALEGDRVQSKIVWENILKVVGGAAVATLIFKGLVHLYKKYKQKQKDQDQERLVLIRVMTPVGSNRLDQIWTSIKQALGVDSLQKYKKSTKRSKIRTKGKSEETTELLVKNKRQPDTQDLLILKNKLGQVLVDYQPTIKTGSIVRKNAPGDPLPAIVIHAK